LVLPVTNALEYGFSPIAENTGRNSRVDLVTCQYRKMKQVAKHRGKLGLDRK
jgi:hypothetical protein